jgi:NAD(P)-dependent dehydrogenase (short-subunit alcohol dehydrogenase family)
MASSIFMPDANRRKILITGGTDGIGLALAKRLVSRHDIVVTGRSSARPEHLPADIAYISADQSEPTKAADTIAQALAERGLLTLDHAILNAGIGQVAPNGIDDADTIRRTLAVNLTANIALAHVLYPSLLKASGTLSLIGSVAHKGSKIFPAYAASKAGLDALARALVSEWQGKIKVQMLHPGPTRTDMHAKAGLDTGKMRRFFIAPDIMAAMIEAEIASNTKRKTLSFAARLGYALTPEHRL